MEIHYKSRKIMWLPWRMPLPVPLSTCIMACPVHCFRSKMRGHFLRPRWPERGYTSPGAPANDQIQRMKPLYRPSASHVGHASLRRCQKVTCSGGRQERASLLYTCKEPDGPERQKTTAEYLPMWGPGFRTQGPHREGPPPTPLALTVSQHRDFWSKTI